MEAMEGRHARAKTLHFLARLKLDRAAMIRDTLWQLATLEDILGNRKRNDELKKAVFTQLDNEKIRVILFTLGTLALVAFLAWAVDACGVLR